MFDALGAVDELSCHVGVARECALRDSLLNVHDVLAVVQCALQDVAAAVATPASSGQTMRATQAKIGS